MLGAAHGAHLALCCGSRLLPLALLFDEPLLLQVAMWRASACRSLQVLRGAISQAGCSMHGMLFIPVVGAATCASAFFGAQIVRWPKCRVESGTGNISLLKRALYTQRLQAASWAEGLQHGLASSCLFSALQRARCNGYSCCRPRCDGPSSTARSAT
jgi:hypothetical protein